MSALDTVLTFIASPEFLVARRLIVVALIIIITLMIAHLFNRYMRMQFNKMRRIHREHPEVSYDPTKYIFLRRIVKLLIYVLGFGAIVYVIPEFRAVSYSIFVGAGVFAVIIGFAAQKVFANMIAGISLASAEPIRVGDKVTIDNYYGTIEDITLRHVLMRTWDNNRIILPNSTVNEADVTNHTLEDANIIQTLEIGISYDSDIDKAKRIIVDAIQNHRWFEKNVDEFTPYVDINDGVSVRVIECGDFAVKLRAYFVVADKPTGGLMSFDVLETVKKTFDKQGILIPYPQRVITYKKDEEKSVDNKIKEYNKEFQPKTKTTSNKKKSKSSSKKRNSKIKKN